MALEILEKAHRETNSQEYRDFGWVEHPGSGYSFELDPEGQPVLDNDLKAYNFGFCLEAVELGTMIDQGTTKYAWSYWVEAKAMCTCGETIWLTEGARCGKCERMYNALGQEILFNDRAGFEEHGGYLNAGERWDEDD